MKNCWKLLGLLLVALLIPCAALGEGEGIILYDDWLRPAACFLPGTPLENAEDIGGNLLAMAGGWKYVAFPKVDPDRGCFGGYLRGDAGDAVAPEQFPAATMLRDFDLESPNAMLGWPEDEGLLRAGDTVYVLGMSAARWYVYANGHYGSIPKLIYGLEPEGAAEAYLEVPQEAQRALAALLPGVAVSAEELQAMNRAAKEAEEAALAACGKDWRFWPRETQRDVDMKKYQTGWETGWQTAEPADSDITEAEARQRAEALVAEVLGESFPLAQAQEGITFCWQGNEPCWVVYLKADGVVLKVQITRYSENLTSLGNGLLPFDIAASMEDYEEAKKARFEAMEAEYGEWQNWSLAQKMAYDPDTYALPDDRCVSAEWAVNAVKEAALASGLVQEEATVGMTNFLRIPSCYGSDLPGVWGVQLFYPAADGSLSYCCAAYVNPVSGEVGEILTGNG